VGAGAATGGQFAPPGSQPAAKGKPPPTASQQKKAALAAKIKALRKILAELEHNQLTARQAQRAATAAATGKAVVHRKSASSTPAKKGAAATSAKQAKAGTPAGKAPAKGHVLTVKEAAAIITQMIAALTTQIRQLANEDGGAVELAFNPAQPRDRWGRWQGIPGMMRNTASMRMAQRAGLIRALGVSEQARRGAPGHHARSEKLDYTGKPGDFGHIRAIMAAAESVRSTSDTAANALHNAGRALGERDMKSVRVHLSVAERATRGTGSHAVVVGIRRSLSGVPRGTYAQDESWRAPRSIGTGQPGIKHGPGYYPSTVRHPGELTTTIGYSWEQVDNAIELAFRYRHGWIKLEADKIRRSLRDAAGVMGGGMPGEKGKLSHGEFQPGSAARAMVGSHVSHREAKGLTNLFAPKGSGKGVHVSKQAERNRAITGVPGITGPFGKHLSKSEARGFTGLFGGDTRKQKLYGKLRKGGPQHNKAQAVLAQARSKQVQMATELSANTGRLSVTPAPRGKPGGPGLYHVKGMGHTPYEQQIVKALIEKRGMPPGKAYAIARAAIRRWSRGGGHVHPEVRAAAGKAEAGELEKQARAKAA
jgi:hypothetical protein